MSIWRMKVWKVRPSMVIYEWKDCDIPCGVKGVGMSLPHTIGNRVFVIFGFGFTFFILSFSFSSLLNLLVVRGPWV